MLQSGRATRPAPPKHIPWPAYAYQRRAVDFLCSQCTAALFLDPGLGKTAIVLDAFRRLKEEGQADRMLVVAPLRVCQLVWRQEVERWTDFQGLHVSLLHGPRKKERLADDADIWLVNPEGVAWLCDQFWGKSLPWDTVVFDELTRFKNARALRSKKIRPKLRTVRRRWGLTGTPTPNGYMDLFGQMLMLDDGASLGKYITHYRQRFFEQGFDGFSWHLRLGADKQIEERIKPYVLRMSADDYLELPPLIPDIRRIQLPPKVQKQYERLKKEMLLELPEGTVTATNAGAVYSKLKQMANGGIYFTTSAMDPRQTSKLHDIKNEYLAELVEELAGQPLLIAYEFQHDLERMQEFFGSRLAYVSKGMSDAAVNALITNWNAGEIDMLAIHPASAGHGLNLQLGSAAHICWYSLTVDYELYDQLIRRVWRQGTKATRIVNHMLIVEKTVDEKSLGVIDKKRRSQDAFLAAVNAEFEIGKEPDMVRKLKRRNAPEPEAEESEDQTEDAPRKRSFVEDDGDSGQARRIQRRLRGQPAEEDAADADEGEDEEEPPAAAKARTMFSEETRRRMEKDEEGEEDEEEDFHDSKRERSISMKRPQAFKVSETDEPPVIDYDKLAGALLSQLFKRLAG